jgi:hypothetical protein
MRGRRAAFVAFAWAALLLSREAGAWCRTSTLRAPPGECSTGTPLMWCSACAGLSVHVDGSLDIPFAEVRREATEAAARWGNVACPDHDMEPPAFELRVTDDTRVFSGINHTGPNANAIWFNSTWRPDALHRAGTIAITIVSFDRRSGEILDADVELNQRTEDNPNGFTFSIGAPSAENADLPTILTHEFGHALGLGHSDQDRAVMWPTAGMGERRLTLNADDIEGVCDIYAFDRRPSLQCDPPGTDRRPDLVCNETPYGGFAPALDGGRVVGGCSVGALGAAGFSVRGEGAMLLALAFAHRRRRAHAR